MFATLIALLSSIAAAQVPEAPPVTDLATLHRWLLQLKSGDSRDDAIREFSRIQPGEDRESIDLLILGLRDPNPYVREYSARCLVKLGPAGKSAIPELSRLLVDKRLREGVLEWGALALAAMWPESARAIECALWSNDDEVRNAIGVHLIRVPESVMVGPFHVESGFLGPTANPHLARRFAGWMTHQDPEVRYRAVRALHHLGVDAGLAIESLLQLIDREKRFKFDDGVQARARILKEAIATLRDTGSSDVVAAP
jgi:hypothetical protein